MTAPVAPVHDVRKVLAVLIACAALSVTGCAERPTQPAWDPAQRLAGQWAWVRSQHSQTGVVVTPSGAGFSAQLTFVRQTATSGTFVYSRIGGDTIEGSFGVAWEDAPGNDFIVIEPSIDFLTRAAWLAVGSDSLRLGGVFEGGYESIYGRVRP